MWKYFGVLCNTITVLLGSLLGILIRRRAGKKKTSSGDNTLPEREPLPDVMMAGLGLCTVFAAASGLVGIESGTQALIAVASVAGGLVIGWALRLDDRLNRLGDSVLTRMKGADGSVKNPAEGVVTACLLFCVGSMTFLGCFEGAANPAGALSLDCHTTLLIKSMLDFVSATCLAVTFGASVMASGLLVLVFQGLLVLLASFLQSFLDGISVMPVLNCVGSVILLAIALNLTGLKKIKTADYLPALVLPVFICWLISALGGQ